VRVITENNYFVLDGSPDPPMLNAHLPRGGCLTQKFMLLFLINSFRFRSAFQPNTATFGFSRSAITATAKLSLSMSYNAHLQTASTASVAFHLDCGEEHFVLMQLFEVTSEAESKIYNDGERSGRQKRAVAALLSVAR